MPFDRILIRVIRNKEGEESEAVCKKIPFFPTIRLAKGKVFFSVLLRMFHQCLCVCVGYSKMLINARCRCVGCFQCFFIIVVPPRVIQNKATNEGPLFCKQPPAPGARACVWAHQHLTHYYERLVLCYFLPSAVGWCSSNDVHLFFFFER